MAQSLYEVKFATFGDKKLLNELSSIFEHNSENKITIMCNGEILNIDMDYSDVEELKD